MVNCPQTGVHIHLIYEKSKQNKNKNKQAAAAENADTSMTLSYILQVQDCLCHQMALIVLYLDTRYDVCGINNGFRDLTNCSVFVTVDL